MTKHTVIADSPNGIYSKKLNSKWIINKLTKAALNNGVAITDHYWTFESFNHFESFKREFKDALSHDAEQVQKLRKEMDREMKLAFTVWILIPALIYLFFRYNGVLDY